MSGKTIPQSQMKAICDRIKAEHPEARFVLLSFDTEGEQICCAGYENEFDLKSIFQSLADSLPENSEKYD